MNLNEGQRAAYDSICAGKSIFLTGPGGTGKSFLINQIYETLDTQGKCVALTAMTGCAALLLHSKAKTLHSWAGIGLGTDSVPLLISKVRKSRRAAVRWLKTDILVIDEVSMMTPDLFEKLDELGKKVRRNERPFGGLQLVLVGDFFQLPPISRDAETAFVFESPVWNTLGLVKHDLTEIVRQKDPIFQGILNEARRGTLSKASMKILRKRMNIDYTGLEIKPTMLFTRRAEVDQINMSHLRKLCEPDERRIFTPLTAFHPTKPTQGLDLKSPEVLDAIKVLDNNASYSRELIIAKGAQVMLLANLNPEAGLVNGSRGVVVGVQPTDSSPELVPLVKFKSCEMLIGDHSWDIADFPGIIRKQIPLRLAYAVTIHKAQGATLDCALIDVGGRTFEYGQAYVALSRLKDLESLYIHDLDVTAFRAHPKVLEFYATPLTSHN